MAELNRQVLINLHSATGTTESAGAKLQLGEIAVLHNNVTDAKIFTKMADGSVATFITDKAVDAKVKVVSDALENHKTAYNEKIAELATADSNLNKAIGEVADDVAALQELVGSSEGSSIATRLTNVEKKASDNADAIATETGAREDADEALGKRIDAVDAKADVNAGAIADEATARGNADTALDNKITAETAAREAADTALDNKITAETAARETLANKVTSAETAITRMDAEIDTLDTNKANAADVYSKTDADAKFETIANVKTKIETLESGLTDAYEAADAAIIGTTADTSAKTTIYGAFAYAKKAEDDAAEAAAAASNAQESADDANEWIENFMKAEELGQTAIDTLSEIQAYIDSDKQGAAAMSAEIAKKVAQTEFDAYKTANDKAVAANTAAIGTNTQAIADEATARGNADTALDNKITAETTARTSADEALGKRIDDEASARGDLAKTVSANTKSIGENAAAIKTLNGAAVKDGQITRGGQVLVAGTVANNMLTFDFTNIVIDCGTF